MWTRRGRSAALVATAALALTGCAAAHHAASSASRSAATTSATTSAAPSPTSRPSPTPTRSERKAAPPDLPQPPKPTVGHTVSREQTRRSGTPLPLPYPTGDATQVITVVAPSTASTTGTLQAWQRSGSGWQPITGPIAAWLGSDGLSAHPSESISATPIGSFTLTQAFGHDANPGTALPYVQTTPADWWISQPGPLYNTRQRCAGSCPFTQGDPNEHLYYETPYYDYAAVIDYNTANAPGGVRAGAGSAFFLHVAVGSPTAGCVAIPADQLVRLLQWLSPSQHPRIVIGVA